MAKTVTAMEARQNFGNLLTQVGGQVQEVAQGIVAEDMAKGINPQTDPRMQVINGLSTSMQSISAAQTPGHDRLHRTNDVLGIGVSVSF